MRKTIILLPLALVFFVLNLNCEKPITLEKADMDYVKETLQKFAPVTIAYDKSILSEADQQVVGKLVQAANYMNKIFLQQVFSKNEDIKNELEKSKYPIDKPYLELFNIMYGPINRLDKNKLFLGTIPVPKGANFYPEDLTKEEFQQWIKDHPEDKKNFENEFHIIRRKDMGLLAIPYSEAYTELLNPAAKLLREAADLSENESLKKFLHSRADAFLNNDYFQSDIDWMNLDSQIEVVIGPYEVYEDNLMGYKAAFESFICVVDPTESEKLQVVSKYLRDLEKNLPYEDKYKNFKRGGFSPIKVVQEIYTAGDTRAGVQTLAFNLPNDERVREAKGFKNVLLKNVQGAKFNKILMPIAEKVMDPSLIASVTFDAYFNHTLLHEISHGLGPGTLTLPNGEKTTVNKMLAETYSIIEECKADVCGNYNVQYLIDKGIFPKLSEKSLYATYLAGMFRSVRFGIQKSHGAGNMIQFNFLLENGAFELDEKTGKFSVNKKIVKEAVKSLANILLTIQAEGNYNAAKDLIKNYGVMTEIMSAALDKLAAIPVDIKPVYEIEKNR
jgi:hypothetical protein